MSGSSMTFAEFTGTIEDDLAEFSARVRREQTRIADFLNAEAEWDAASLVPPVTLYRLARSATIRRAIARWNEEILPEIVEQSGRVLREVREGLGRLVGDPLLLRELAEAYSGCRAELLPNTPSIEEELAALGRHWSGRGYESYSAVAATQATALGDMADTLDEAARLTNDAATALLESWGQLVHTLHTKLSEFVALIGAIVNLNSVISLEVPALAQAASVSIDFVADVTDILHSHFIVQLSVGVSWTQLNQGAQGLPNNEWPIVHGELASSVASPSEWQVP